MRIEKGGIINDFIEPNKCQYAIPVYQRNYEWSGEQCRKLFDDVVNAHINDHMHFCGSIVYALLKQEKKISYYVIIDGQQRLTTIFLLIKALIDSADNDADKDTLRSSLFNVDKFKKYDIDDSSKLKLKPIKSDNNQLLLLMEDHVDQMDKSSGIYGNYALFCELIKEFLTAHPDMSVSNIYDGLEHLMCATIRLEDEDDNAQEIFERINSTGVPLNLADKIRNFVLMTEKDQVRLFEDYWLKMETMLTREQLPSFFLDYLNMKLDGFAKESTAYKSFKELYTQNGYTNEEMLKELLHYATFYHVFLHGNSNYSEGINTALLGLRQLNQSTVYLFLFHVFDDFQTGLIKATELEKILNFLLAYSIRRIMCEISSNSLRGLYKTLYGRVFAIEANKEHYYDAIVSFMQQLTSRDVIPTDEEFLSALKQNNLYRKHALCRFLLIAIENQGKEKVQTDNLSIEHIMPQNKNLSSGWQKMLGENWAEDKDRWLHTLGNLTLTGYNSELGDRPFEEKKSMIEAVNTKIVVLYHDVQAAKTWNAAAIQQRAVRLSKEVLQLFPVVPPEHPILFVDTRYEKFTVEEPSNATYKVVNYYELLGERIKVDSFAFMVRSVARKLYELDSTIIEDMAKKNERFPNWLIPAFSYDEKAVKGGKRLLKDNTIYIATGFSAYDCICFIRAMLRKYNLDITEDFVYSAMPSNLISKEDDK